MWGIKLRKLKRGGIFSIGRFRPYDDASVLLDHVDPGPKAVTMGLGLFRTWESLVL